MNELEKKQDELILNLKSGFDKVLAGKLSCEEITKLEADLAALKQQGETKRSNFKCPICGKSLYDCDSSCFYKDKQGETVSDDEIKEYLTEKLFEQKTKESELVKASIWKFVKWMRNQLNNKK